MKEIIQQKENQKEEEKENVGGKGKKYKSVFE